MRDRLNLLAANYKKKVRAEEKASGIEVEESEIDQLLLEIVEKFEEAKDGIDKATAEKNETAKAEHSATQEQRQRAIKSLGETNKRKREYKGDEEPPKRSRKTGSDTIAYLTERTEKEFEMREKELQQKRKEMDLLRGLALQNTNAQSSPSASKQQLSDIQQMLHTTTTAVYDSKFMNRGTV